MKRYRLTVTPHSSLYIGGYAPAQGESDGDTARDDDGMLIPATVVKGALREAATRLVNAAGRGHEIVAKLFGEAVETEGLLRLGPLRAVAADGSGALPDLTLRHHVSLERATRQAAPGRLFQNRVTAAGYGLRFQGELTAARELTDDEQGLLEAARRITDQVGGGRGRGLGLVEVDLQELDAAPEPTPAWEIGEASTIVLVLEATESLRLGVVKSRDNVMSSKDYLDGSAVRGAVAASLGRIGHTEALDLVLGGTSPARFGNGYPGHFETIPAPLTLLEPKGEGHLIDDAAALCAHALGGLPFRRVGNYRSAKGTFASDGTSWSKVTVQRRVITRNARNLVDGRAAPGLLYSLEVVEPVLLEGPRLVFYVPVTGHREQLEHVVEAAVAGLTLGGARTRGQGQLRLRKVRTDAPLRPLAERHARWCERLRGLGLENPEASGVLLAVGPLAVDQKRLKSVLETHELKLFHGVSRRQAHGGWNSRARLPRTVVSQFVPGSTFIVKHRNGESALPALAELEQRGIGPGRPDGWGHWIACHSIHVDGSEEERT